MFLILVQQAQILSRGSQPVGLELWGMTPLGVISQISYIPCVYITIYN